MRFTSSQLLFALSSLSLLVGCATDPVQKFTARMDSAPVEKRPKDWELTKTLMARPAPAVGQLAPDFTLPTLDGVRRITRSAHQEGRPLVLIFGSFT
jgi:hypothetical protein